MIICIDFDGVLHWYREGWKGATNVYDPPVPGAIQWLRTLIQDEELIPMIYSSRSKEQGAVEAMKTWLIEWGLLPQELEKLAFPVSKPAAFLTIDDRAICFQGEFIDITPEQIKSFRPWYKKEDPDGSEH